MEMGEKKKNFFPSSSFHPSTISIRPHTIQQVFSGVESEVTKNCCNKRAMLSLVNVWVVKKKGDRFHFPLIWNRKCGMAWKYAKGTDFLSIAWNVYVYRFFLCVWKIFANPTHPKTWISILLWWWSSFIVENGPRYVYTHVAHLKTKQKYVNHLKWYQHMSWKFFFVFLGIPPLLPPGYFFSSISFRSGAE